VSAFLALWGEALRDAVRRKLVGAIAVTSLLSLVVLDNCAGCAPALQMNGQAQDAASLAPYFGTILLGVVGLWVVALAGLLAADHLTQSLEDGHAGAALARPVSRHAFAFARLAGALSVALAAGAVLFGTTAFWVTTRSGLPPAPAALAGLACALACAFVAAVAMATSLWLPRLATWLVVLALVFATTLAAGTSFASPDVAARLAERFPSAWPLLTGLDDYGPPIASAMLRALSPWIGDPSLPADFAAVLARGAVWVALAAGALAAAFRRIELR
jgi:ABC-type transport system involved in multi-copper enzyme maturation permease subunit